jgi:hypothetical protein
MSSGVLLVITIILVALVFLLLLALLLGFRRGRRPPPPTPPTPVPTPPTPVPTPPTPVPTPPGPTPPTPPGPTPPTPPSPTPTPGSAPKIPDVLDGVALGGVLIPRLTGTPADGAKARATGATPRMVVWVDGGDEVLAHLDSVRTQIASQVILVSIDLETDQTGRATLVVPFAIGRDDTAGLVAVTDEFPRGNGLLAARWGAAVQAAAWSALLALASDHASERGLAPRGLAITDGRLRLVAGQALSASQL